MRGAWIEIFRMSEYTEDGTVSLPMRGAWIEMVLNTKMQEVGLSLPMRGAWIEIRTSC